VAKKIMTNNGLLNLKAALEAKRLELAAQVNGRIIPWAAYCVRCQAQLETEEAGWAAPDGDEPRAA